MTWISNTITVFGLVLLAHAGYSAQEHAALQSFRAASPALTSSSSSSSSLVPIASLPIDISIETVVALVVVCLGLITGAAPLRPIRWRAWAGKIEREGEAGFTDNAGEVNKDYIGNPFKLLETRPGFVDIRKQRKEFAEWVKKGDGK